MAAIGKRMNTNLQNFMNALSYPMRKRFLRLRKSRKQMSFVSAGAFVPVHLDWILCLRTGLLGLSLQASNDELSAKSTAQSATDGYHKNPTFRYSEGHVR
jgi:hypothetical protein